MSEIHPSQACTREGNEVDFPTINFKDSSFRKFCSASSFQDSGYSELSKSYSFDNTDKECFEQKGNSPTLLCEQPETSNPGLAYPLESSIQTRFFSPAKENNAIPKLCDTPKISGRRFLPRRRRLEMSFDCVKEKFESQNDCLESNVSQVLHLETSSTFSFPRQSNFSPLVLSTVKTEETTSNNQKLRLIFSQQKTSTVDDSKDDCSLFEVDSLSPIQGNSSKDSVTHDFSDSSLSANDENTYPECLGSSVNEPTCGRDEDIFMTPISNVTNTKFNVRQRFSPSAEVRVNISTPEDSGFNSLCLDRSKDIVSDQEGSFEELLQKRKASLKVGDTVRKSRHLLRLRRLSTLREQGSQSETEEEKHTIQSGSVTTPAAPSDTSESQLSSDKSGDLSFKDLSNTPALQLMHELFMRSKRKKIQDSSAHEFLEEGDMGEITVLQCVLAGLIGKKMGIEKLDILTELKYRNLKHILAMVLDSLTAETLCSMWKVSKDWREIIVQDKNANKRRKHYMAQLKTDSEVETGKEGKMPQHRSFPQCGGGESQTWVTNMTKQAPSSQGAILNVEDAATRLQLINRSALRSVQAQARTPGSQKEQGSTFSPWGEVLTPIANSSDTHLSSKQEEYVKVAKTLFIGEAIKPCPRCQSPAKYQPYKKRGLCSRAACGFDFCVLCLCAYHGSEECSRGTTKSRYRRDALPGSAQSKQNLKRL
ncbi:F-box only protein 43 isoform X2 [Erinaceus europaeus]|uniref:F-box only protein 43 isoform X2 n=1 Tax=Erinaceus europaeus TaxID=9365 RepID=A0ABM3XT50_ERIEU|nr:F-box only protein 43 isoform X2 [Erinaceus europaeus]